MNFHFSSQVNRNLSDFLDLSLFLISGGVVLSFFSRYFWFFNLFDQFWAIYLFASVILVIIFAIFKKSIRVLISISIVLICSTVFLKTDKHISPKLNSSFKIYYQNINSSNSSYLELSQNIKRSNAEIIALVEATPEIENNITPVLTNYPNHLSFTQNDNFGFLVLSKAKIKLEERHENYGIPVYVKFFVEKYNIKIYLLHLPPPVWREAWETQKEVLTLISKEVDENKDQSFLILGDLNMTTQSSQFQDFYRSLNSRFYSEELFFQGTWPSFIPSYFSLPIDHVLSNRRIETKIGSSAGSDHKSIVININRSK